MLIMTPLCQMATWTRASVLEWTNCEQSDWYFGSDALTFQAMDLQDNDDWVAFGAIDNEASKSAFVILKQIGVKNFERVWKFSKDSQFFDF